MTKKDYEEKAMLLARLAAISLKEGNIGRAEECAKEILRTIEALRKQTV
jgi:hypothetical protein